MDLTPSYDASENVQFFKIERKIEYIPIVSILIASLYRNLKLVDASESDSNVNANELFNQINSEKKLGDIFSNEELKNLFYTSLSVPSSDTQLKVKKFLINPLVPEIGNFGLAARHAASPWNPGAFIIEIIANSVKSSQDFIDIITKLRTALIIDPNNESDLWALCVKNEFTSLTNNLPIDGNSELNENYFLDLYNKNKKKKHLYSYSKNSEIFITDLINIINLKNKLTRQKWVGILEGYLRLTIFNHIIYTLNLSKSYLELIYNKINNNDSSLNDDDLNDFLNNKYIINDIRLKVGSQRKLYIVKNIDNYSYYNSFVYYILNNIGESSFVDFDNDSFYSVSKKVIKYLKDNNNAKSIKLKFNSEHEDQLSKYNENYSSFKNIKESLEYLCSRKTSTNSKFISDVNFIFEKSTSSNNAPYIFSVSAGVISTLTALIFLRQNYSYEFISGLEFIKELQKYNIELSIKDISEGKIKETLLSLGIVIDSPDTEGGILIMKPGWI
jgi:hypothetical protein